MIKMVRMIKWLIAAIHIRSTFSENFRRFCADGSGRLALKIRENRESERKVKRPLFCFLCGVFKISRFKKKSPLLLSKEPKEKVSFKARF